MITLKLLFDGEGIILLIMTDVNLLKGIFLVEEMCKFIPSISHIGLGEGRAVIF